MTLAERLQVLARAADDAAVCDLSDRALRLAERIRELAADVEGKVLVKPDVEPEVLPGGKGTGKHAAFLFCYEAVGDTPAEAFAAMQALIEASQVAAAR